MQTASIGSDELRLYLRENFEEDVNRYHPLLDSHEQS